MNEDQIDSVLAYWFTNQNDPTDQWNASLWFFGGEEVDAYILQHYSHLMETVSSALRNPQSSPSASWLSPKGKVAAIILLDQFPRNAYRGSSRMLQYDELAGSLAKELFEDREVPFESLPWTHRLFVLICLTHMEDEFSVNQAAIGLSALGAQLSQDPQVYAPVLVTRLKRVFKSTEEHLAVIKR